MTLVVMYFAGKVEHSLAICDFVDHGYRVPGVFSLCQILLTTLLGFMYPSFSYLCAHARKGGGLHTNGSTLAGYREVMFNKMQLISSHPTSTSQDNFIIFPFILGQP
jgi:hypothetical protein